VATQAEYDDCVQIQYETWGAGFTEAVPATILRVSQNIGGVTAGAFDSSGQLLGFVFGMTGVQHGILVHWSDLLAVRAAARDQEVGRRLKLYQRELLIPLGVRMMYWTYDPLVAKNAHLNIVRLGAKPIQYVANMYGQNSQSALHGALGTDRFVVAWDLNNELGTLIAPHAGDSMRAQLPVVNQPERKNGSLGVPKIIDLPDAPFVRIEVPTNIQQLIDADPDMALEWRATTRRALIWYFDRNYRVAAFFHNKSDDRCYYTLAAPPA
jgi:chorismate synthase